MRVSFFVNDAAFFISHRLALAEALKKKNFSVEIISNKHNLKELDEYEITTIPIERSNISVLNNLVSLFKTLIYFRNTRSELIHNITLKPILFATLVSFFFPKIKIVNAVSGLGYLFTSNRNSFSKQLIFFLLKIILLRKNTHFIFQNEKDLDLFKQLGLKSNFTLIKGSGVDAKKFLYTPPKEKAPIDILCTSRMLKDKGIIELIEASKLLANKGKSFQLTLLGKIDLENPAHITEHELINAIDIPQIKWLGYSDKIKDALKKCHIYCLPSYREGLPKSIVEAMAIGRPIVTTTAPGCEDCVIEGVNGYKVPIKDAYALAEKLEVLIDDSSLRLKMGKASRKIFEKEFTLDKVVKKHMEIYDNMLMI